MNSSVALDSLKTVLDAWKKGEKAASLQDASPSITAQDFDWEAGAKLVDYQLKDDGKSYGVNLHVPVALTLRTSQGREVKKNVSYVVGTSPRVTVFRALR